MRRILISLFCLSIFLVSVGVVSAFTPLSAPNLVVNDPVDGGIYNSRAVVFDMDTNQKSNFYVTKNIFRPAGWKRLCRNTMGCEKKVTVREGDNRVLVKAVNSAGETVTEVISFFVDTKGPRISKTTPRRRSVTNGDLFTIKYSENNLERVTLFYGRGTETVTKMNCPSGRNTLCEFMNVDVSMFDGEEINYWFEAEDVAGNIDTSKPVRVVADTTDPIVHFFDYEIVRRNVNFVFEIEEKNFDAVMIYDQSVIRPKWKTLCSRLVNGRCNVRKSFRSGDHMIDLKAVDKAGNSVMIVQNELISI